MFHRFGQAKLGYSGLVLYSIIVPTASKLTVTSKRGTNVLRSNYRRSGIRPIQNDFGLKVDIENCTLGQQKMTWVFKLTQLPPAGPGEGERLG